MYRMEQEEEVEEEEEEEEERRGRRDLWRFSAVTCLASAVEPGSAWWKI